jgi:hypothetical protein
MATISKRKHKCFDIEAYYRNESKTFQFGPITLERKQNILIWSKIIFIASRSFPFWPKSSGTKQSNFNYLCTYDLYSPVRNVFDAGRYLRGEVVGGLALEISSFVGPCEMARADRRVLFGAQLS